MVEHASSIELWMHAGSWESTREVGREREKLEEHAGSWESTREVGRERGKLRARKSVRVGRGDSRE